MHPWLQSFIGGLLIGGAVWLMLAGIGRVTGISGIAATALVQPRGSGWRFAFVIGLIAGGWLTVRLLTGSAILQAPSSGAITGLPGLLLAGLLVGVGTVIGSGCTSGHGVCGLGRRSLRSLVATLTFMLAGMLTVAVIRALQAGGSL